MRGTAARKRDSDDAREERLDSSRGEEDVVIRAADDAAKAIATMSLSLSLSLAHARSIFFFLFFPFIYFSMDNYQNVRLGTASKVGVATNKYRHMIIR